MKIRFVKNLLNNKLIEKPYNKLNMRKLSSLLLLICLLIISASQLVQATHVAGADITYRKVDVGTYIVTVGVFEDCGGSASVGPTISVLFKDSCTNSSFTATLDQVSIDEVSQICSAEINTSTCNGGTLPGMLKKVYKGTVALGDCENWTIVWGIANRSNSVNLDPAGNTYFFATTARLNSMIENNSPVFNAQPIPNVCAGQLVNFSFAVSESEGDSLVYSFANPLGGTMAAPTILNFQPGYSINQPLPGITMDPVSGIVSLTPTVLGNFVMVVKILEYRNGVLIGMIQRDLQFAVRSCTNNQPNMQAGEITNFSGDGVQTGPYTIEMCEGNTISFTATYTDADAADKLSINSNIEAILYLATVDTIGTNPLTMNISWTAQPGSSIPNNQFTVYVIDSVCTMPGIQSFIYNINVIPSTFILPENAAVCSGTPVPLSAFGGDSYIWYDINGNQIVPSSEFSCNNCSDPIVSPSVTTSYIVESNLIGGCTNRDTIVVTISSSAGTSPFVQQNGYFLETITGYSAYQWYDSNGPIANATNYAYTPTASGDYYVLVTDSTGCQAQSLTLSFVFVGLNESLASSQLILVPNPANNFVILQSTNNTNFDGTLKVWTINGVLMFDKTMIKGNQYKIDIEQWANGMYMIELIGDKKSERFKFIKQQ